MITTFNDSAFFFSSQLDFINIDSDVDRVFLYVSDAEGNIIFQNDYFTVDGNAVVYNVNDVINAYLINNGLAIADLIFTVKDEDDEIIDNYTVAVAYASVYLPEGVSAADFAKARFLTSADSAKIAPGSTFLLNWYQFPDEPNAYKISVLYYDADDKLNQYSFTQFVDEVEQQTLRQIIIDSKMIVQLTQEELQGKADIRSIAVAANGRLCNLYIDNNIDDVTAFIFRNDFNTSEIIQIPASVKRNFKTSNQIASAINRKVAVAQPSEYAFELSAKVSPIMYDQFMALGNSIETSMLIDRNNLSAKQNIVISETDFTDVSDSYELADITLKFELADSKLHLKHKPVSRFNDKYSNIYF